MSEIDPNDADFIDNMKRLIGINAKGIEELLPKFDSDALIELAAAVTNRDKKEVMRLLKVGRQKTYTMSEDRLVGRIRKEKQPLMDSDSDLILNVGDPVRITYDDGDHEDGTIKIPKAPGDTVGVMIGGSLEMVHRRDVSKVTEGVLGMTGMPSIALRRMQELAGIAPEGEPSGMMGVEITPGELGMDRPGNGMSGDVEIESIPANNDMDACGASALSLLDKLSGMLPNLRLADIKAVRKRINDITLQMNESVGAPQKPMITGIESRKLKR
ncbi:unnamed protein product [Sphagnum tenellum]